ncbi:unnamed protein product [Fusarium equiseti]|uniref:C6 transcription factor n=1 Tax=Fusarium equiseti TaxID=61235 RepID=A0A8J2IQ72_FUSEQ|nr:unnamed protein product [Fusarium equiseti]
MVVTAIVTVATCHYIQSLTGSTLPGLPPPVTDQAPPLITPKTDIAGLPTSERALVNYYLLSKELILKLVSSHLAMQYPRARDEASVIAIVLLAVLDIFESGSGAWNVHLEASKKLIEPGSINRSIVWDSSVEALLCEAATFQILGSSLARPGALNSESTLPVTQIRTSSPVAPIGCPVAILSAIETFALKRRVNGMFALQIADVEYLKDTLNRLRSYDIAAWAMNITVNESMVPYMDLIQLGTIWRLSAEIYACYVLFNLTGDASILKPSLVDDLIARYTFLEREDDNLLKCLIWPTFIAGAATINQQRRPWKAYGRNMI